MNRKPLGRKSYGSIPHLPNSRMGPADHHCSEGQARIATERVRDKDDVVIVQEKLDGSNVGVCKVNGEVYPITRAGYIANTSPYKQHHLFYDWAIQRKSVWDELLCEGERICGEWLALAHGTRYDLSGSSDFQPFAAFDLFEADGLTRIPYSCLLPHCRDFDIDTVGTLFTLTPLSANEAMHQLSNGGECCTHKVQALDPIEGAVWRVERKGVFDFAVKYVRPDKVDGCYLPEISGKPEVWNWRPD